MRTSQKGQATLSLVLLIGGIAFAISITLALSALSSISVGFGADAQQRARGAALAGVEDAALRLARNPGFSSLGYSVPLETASASVVVTQGVPSASQVTVVSNASAGSRDSELSAIFAIDPLTGIATLTTVQ